MMAPPESLKARVLAAARQRPVPARAPHPLRTFLAVFGAMLAMSITFLFAGPYHAAGRPAPFAFAVVGGTTVVALAVTWLATPRRGSMLGRSRGWLILAIVAVPILVGAWTMLWHVGYADPFERFGTRCFLLSLATAPWPFAALAWLRRGFDPNHPALTGATLGSAAGAWAGVVVAMWCPLADPGHVVRGHVLPLMVLMGLGAAIGSRLFAMRRI